MLDFGKKGRPGFSAYCHFSLSGTFSAGLCSPGFFLSRKPSSAAMSVGGAGRAPALLRCCIRVLRTKSTWRGAASARGRRPVLGNFLTDVGIQFSKEKCCHHCLKTETINLQVAVHAHISSSRQCSGEEKRTLNRCLLKWHKSLWYTLGNRKEHQT